MFILMAHNSFAVNPAILFANQNFPETSQFEAGIRGFSMDVFERNDGSIYMEHGPGSDEIDYKARVQEILDVLESGENQHEFVLIQFEDELDTALGVANVCEAWGDKLITNFDITTNLGEYLVQGKQVLLMTNVITHVNAAVGMHDANKLLAENDFEWTSTASGPNMNHRRGPTGGGQYAKMLNYFCTTPPFYVGSREYSTVVNTKARMQCHAQEFKQQYGNINVVMIDFYDLPMNEPNAFSAQEAIRNGDFGSVGKSDCIQGSDPFCKGSGSSCSFFGSCSECCYASSCSALAIFNCKCN
jgi:nitrate reductase cytochrome c-type subunit